MNLEKIDTFYKINRLSNFKKFNVTDIKSIEFRSSTNGFQPKYFTDSYFIKQQAMIGGRLTNDWLVEIIASDLANRLGIPCVIQQGCEIINSNKKFNGVYSHNFEKNGYQFISFRTLLRMNKHDIEDFNFTKCSTIEKLECMVNCLIKFANIKETDARKYFVNMALIDCLVGNVDRHDKNFGVFYKDGEFTTALLFDNGMGMFEHSPYLDSYMSWEEAMREVYVAPYGEDPFDMIDILNSHYDIKKLCLGVDLSIDDEIFPNEFAKEYYKHILERVI